MGLPSIGVSESVAVGSHKPISTTGGVAAASETCASCCNHPDCKVNLRAPLCREYCRVVFMTTEPLREEGLFVEDRFRRMYPEKFATHGCTVLNNAVRTKWGFYICQVMMGIPNGVEFRPEGLLRLETLCTSEGQVKPILFRHSCCGEKTRLVDECINMNWSDREGAGPEQDGASSADVLLGELAERISDLIGTTCDIEEGNVDCDKP